MAVLEGAGTGWYFRQSGTWRSMGSNAWTRPTQWLTLPTIGSTEQKMVALFAVFPTTAKEYSNVCEFRLSGNYTVDWGDGSAVENITSNVSALHTYSYTALSSTTDTTRGYRQAIITVTPQSGQNITSILLNRNDSGNHFSGQWLEISINAASLATLTVGDTTRKPLLESVILKNNAIISAGNTFANCVKLQNVDLSFTSLLTGATGTFSGCIALQTVPLFNLSSLTNATSMFNSCYSLQTVPLFNLSSLTNATSMFLSCVSLQSIPLWNLAALTIGTSMFSGCTALQSIPAFNFAALTTTTTMFGTPITSLAYVYASFKVTISFASSRLNRQALIDLFTNLATVTGQTITVTGATGAASLTAADKAIATDKGWTVTV